MGKELPTIIDVEPTTTGEKYDPDAYTIGRVIGGPYHSEVFRQSTISLRERVRMLCEEANLAHRNGGGKAFYTPGTMKTILEGMLIDLQEQLQKNAGEKPTELRIQTEGDGIDPLLVAEQLVNSLSNPNLRPNGTAQTIRFHGGNNPQCATKTLLELGTGREIKRAVIEVTVSLITDGVVTIEEE